MRAATLVLVQGMVGTPIVFAFVWIMLEVVVYSGIGPTILGIVFALLVVFDEILMYYFVRPALTNPWKNPTRVIENGLEDSGILIPREKIKKITRYDQSLSIAVEGRKNKLFASQLRLGSFDEFIVAMKGITPSIEIQDMRRGKFT